MTDEANTTAVSCAPLRVLSLDGGGIRGISSLLILENIMEKIRDTKQLDHVPRPCDHFDLIGGTSTGGIIAIMLGRLGMTVRECIQAYRKVAQRAFAPTKYEIPPVSSTGAFSANALEAAIKQTVKEFCVEKECVTRRHQGHSTLETCCHSDMAFHDRSCTKTVVLAITKDNVGAPPTLFKTYDTSARFNGCTIWQIARATSAAMAFFKPIKIGQDGLEFVDSGFEYNNPCEVLVKEARQQFPEHEQMLVLSIGAGLGDIITIDNTQPSIITALKEMVTFSEKVAASLDSQYGDTSQYHRFNVNQGLQDITLSDWDTASTISAHTRNYLSENERRIKQFVEDFANTAQDRERYNSKPQRRSETIGGDGFILQKLPPIASSAGTGYFLGANKLSFRARTPDRPKPSSTVPFERDRMFVGREDILTAIKEANQQGTRPSHKRVALVGIGGVGKSQIAIEYTYRIRESAPNTWAFWIHARNATQFEQGYREIASVAKIPGWDNPRIDILQLVNKWLCDEKNGDWLVVLDNADDNVFCEPSGRNAPLADYLPRTSNGSILITSRNKMAAQNLVRSYNNMISVEPMSTDDALTLLQTRIHVDESYRNEARVLVDTLKRIPLAITQAGTCIANRAPQITVLTYLELFQQDESNQKHLLKYDDPEDLRRGEIIWHPVITTLQISLNQIHHISPMATDLLALMSMFDWQGIPEHLVNRDMGRLDFKNAIAPLISLSLIRANIGGQSFEMHRVVQLSIHQLLKQQGQFQKWVQQSQRVMEEAFPSGYYETWSTCRILLPHVKEVMQFTEFDKDNQLNKTRIANRCGWYLYSTGEPEEAEAMYRQALTAKGKMLGAEHPDMLTTVNNLGLVLKSQGKYEEAEAMYRQALTVREKVLGAEHPDTLISVSNLGLVLESQGKYKEAEAMHRRDLQGIEKVLGTEHPDTLTSVNHLGLVLENQGRYKEAEAMHRRALIAREKVLGPEHPDTLTSVNNLGLVLKSQGKYEEAEAMHRRDLQGIQKVLGGEHPDTLASVSNLGLVLKSQGKYEEAEAMHRRALTTRGKVLGPEHPDTLTSANHLGVVLENQGKYEEAEAMHQRALTARERVLGAEHPDTLTSINNLGLVFKSQGKYEEAEALHRQDLQGCEKVLGAEHPDTLISINNLGLVLKSQGKYEEAEAIYQRALTASEKVLGTEHPDTLITVSNLGLMLESQGRYEEAEAMHRRALTAREKLLGAEHPDTLSSVSNLSSVLKSQDKYEEAEAIHKRS